jgi:hypothetical protein
MGKYRYLANHTVGGWLCLPDCAERWRISLARIRRDRMRAKEDVLDCVKQRREQQID